MGAAENMAISEPPDRIPHYAWREAMLRLGFIEDNEPCLAKALSEADYISVCVEAGKIMEGDWESSL